MTEKLTVEQIDGEYFIEFPPAFLARQGWGEGTNLIWTVHEDQSVTLEEVKDEPPPASPA